MVDWQGEEESWSLLWDERYKGKLGQLGSAGDAWWCAAIYANVDFNEAQTKMAVAEYERTILNALAEVENALTNEYYLSEREQALKKAAEQSLGARNLAEIQYSRGVSDFLTMLESTRAAFDTESRYISTILEFLY